MSMLSHQLAAKKLEKKLQIALAQVDNGSGSIGFGELGEFMHILGIYKVIYNPNYGITPTPRGEVRENKSKE